MGAQLDFRSKILLCVLPFVIGIAVICCLVVPQYNDYSDKSTSLQNKKNEQKDLETKLADSAKIMKEQKQLEDAIAALRGAVPRTPDLEVLYIDLEKLCMDSGLELLSISPGADAQKKPEEKGKGKETKKGTDASDVGLVKKTVELKLYGSYKALMSLVEKLEHYQRVVTIGEVHMSVPAGPKVDPFAEGDATAGGAAGDPDYSHMKLSLTTYYLP